MTAQLPEGARLQSLQALRGIAALLVVLYHTGTLYAVHTGQVLWQNAFRAGFAGVDVFFVLSGVVICCAHAGDCYVFLSPRAEALAHPVNGEALRRNAS